MLRCPPLACHARRTLWSPKMYDTSRQQPAMQQTCRSWSLLWHAFILNAAVSASNHPSVAALRGAATTAAHYVHGHHGCHVEVLRKLVLCAARHCGMPAAPHAAQHERQQEVHVGLRITVVAIFIAVIVVTVIAPSVRL